MSDASTAIARLPDAAQQQLARLDVPSDDEIRRLYRIAEALAASGVYKDAQQAGQAFAKIILGRDLGLTPAQSMSGLHFVEGQVQMHYRTLGNFVRSNGYHYRFGAHASGEFVPMQPTNESVTLAFYGPADEQGDREWLGDSTFDDADVQLAELGRTTRSGALSNHVKYPRNMKIARAMSNGVGWYCPEVMRGIPVYVEGEIKPDVPQLTAGAGDGAAQGLDLGPDVEQILIRARELGHAGLADRATVEMTLGRQSPTFVRNWVQGARRELDRAEVESRARSATESLSPVEEAVSGEVVDAAPEAAQAVGDAAREPSAEEQAEINARQLKIDRLLELRNIDPASVDTEQQVSDIDAEIDALESELDDDGIEF
jgi:hypothetical protein